VALKRAGLECASFNCQ